MAHFNPLCCQCDTHNTALSSPNPGPGAGVAGTREMVGGGVRLGGERLTEAGTRGLRTMAKGRSQGQSGSIQPEAGTDFVQLPLAQDSGQVGSACS